MNADKKSAKLLQWLFPLVCSIVLALATPDILAETIDAENTISPPPSVELEYVVRVRYTAMSIGGKSSIKWEQNGNEYAIKTSARCNLLGKVLETSSAGNIDQHYLKPLVFTEKRRKRDETKTTFDQQNNTLTFSESKRSLPFSQGIQDRASVIWQIASLAKAHPEQFRSGNKLSFNVVGRNRIDKWDINIGDEETLLTGLKEDVQAIYMIRTDSKGKTTEVWLAPSLNWYPVRLIFSDNKDLRMEQIINKIKLK